PLALAGGRIGSHEPGLAPPPLGVDPAMPVVEPWHVVVVLEGTDVGVLAVTVDVIIAFDAADLANTGLRLQRNARGDRVLVRGPRRRRHMRPAFRPPTRPTHVDRDQVSLPGAVQPTVEQVHVLPMETEKILPEKRHDAAFAPLTRGRTKARGRSRRRRAGRI